MQKDIPRFLKIEDSLHKGKNVCPRLYKLLSENIYGCGYDLNEITSGQKIIISVF